MCQKKRYALQIHLEPDWYLTVLLKNYILNTPLKLFTLSKNLLRQWIYIYLFKPCASQQGFSLVSQWEASILKWPNMACPKLRTTAIYNQIRVLSVICGGLATHSSSFYWIGKSTIELLNCAWRLSPGRVENDTFLSVIVLGLNTV